MKKHVITEISVDELDSAVCNARSTGLKTFSYRDVMFDVGYATYLIEWCKGEGRNTIRMYELNGE